MSLPYLLEILQDIENSESSNSSPIYGGHFGLGLQPRYIHHRPQTTPSIRLPLAVALAAGRLSDPRREGKGEAVISNVGKDGFQVCMDVQHFKPSELSVKVIDDSVVVEGKHEEREDDHGYISRHFVRRYALPKDYDADKVMSALSSDGVLTVSIPKPKALEKPAERVIQIQQTGPAHLNVKENGEEKSEKETESAENGDQ
ncbi:heat shock protein 23-like [Episyrphus balteatus]|uniref:heat shock protein 23-like n=1 Tax=Episyrphus balteatus TaxID=286459 RepID=UPI0024869538|nr:heat shock protein 23-like [Episyrphus balteatus]